MIGISSGVSLPAPPSSTPDTNAPKSSLASSVSAKLSFVFQNPLAPLPRASSRGSLDETDALESSGLPQGETTCQQGATSSGGIMSMVANILSPQQQREKGEKERSRAVEESGADESGNGQENDASPIDLVRETSSQFGMPTAAHAP